MLATLNLVGDPVKAADHGADHYLIKPFSNSELLSRIKALPRRIEVPASQALKVFQCGKLRTELGKRRIFVGAHETHLTPIEFRLLTELADHAGFVVTRRQLLRKIRRPSHTEHDHYLRIYMGRLRPKIEADPARPHYIITEAGVGHRLRDREN